MFARVEKLKYRNYPKNSNSRKGSSKSWKLLISPQSSKPTLLEGEYPIQNLRGHHLFPLGQVSASEATRHPLATPLNRIESKTGAAGGERPGGGGRGGVIRGATVGNRGHEGAERERGRGKDEEGSCSRSSKSKSIESISLSSPYFFTLFSLSLEPRFQGRQMMRVPRGDVVTSLVLPPFLYPPPCERHLFHPAVTRICNFLFVRPPIRLEDRFEEEFQSGAIFRFVSIA